VVVREATGTWSTLYDGLAALDFDSTIRLDFLSLLTHDRAVPNFIPAIALAKPLASVKPHHDIWPPPTTKRRGRASGGGRGSRGGARGRGDVGRGARGRGGGRRGRGRGALVPLGDAVAALADGEAADASDGDVPESASSIEADEGLGEDGTDDIEVGLPPMDDEVPFAEFYSPPRIFVHRKKDRLTPNRILL
jgi:hypothetical protein